MPNKEIREIIENCCKWRAHERWTATQIYGRFAALGDANEQFDANVRALASFVRRRIAESKTLYIVGSKQRTLEGWGRMLEVHHAAERDLRRFFNARQLQMMADGVNSGQFVAHSAFDKLDEFQGKDLDASMTHGIYLWRSLVTKRGYVGKVERNSGSRQKRDFEHRALNKSPFDRHLAVREQQEKWSCVSVCVTEPVPPEQAKAVKQQDDNIRLECLLTLILNTYTHRDGWNTELGGVWGATKAIIRQRAERCN